MSGRVTAALALAGLLAACAAQPRQPELSPAAFAEFQAALAQSPSARASFERSCLANDKLTSDPESRMGLAAIMDVELDEVEQAACARVTAAVARGDLTYEDYLGMGDDPPNLETLRALMRALRRQPGQIES